jgi:hypothetical protein
MKIQTKYELNWIIYMNMKNFENLMEEIGFQITKLNDGTIDRPEFCQAIAEIHEYFNTTITI